MAKKSFMQNLESNPAKAFINTETQPAPKVEETLIETPAAGPQKIEIPEGFYVDRKGNLIERRTRRVQMVFAPSVFERVKEKADQEGKSFNDYVHEMLENSLK